LACDSWMLFDRLTSSSCVCGGGGQGGDSTMRQGGGRVASHSTSLRWVQRIAFAVPLMHRGMWNRW
jgi:hypothetical protein